MLTKFKVKNYRGFNNEITWDLSKPSNYNFNEHLINKEVNVIKNGIICGKNGSGKSNFGRALFDIYGLIKTENDYWMNVYAGLPNDPISFEYSFRFPEYENVTYSYSKNYKGALLSEQLWVDGVEIFYRKKGTIILNNEFKIDASVLSKLSETDTTIPLINYIENTFPLSDSHYIKQIKNFVTSMLWFKCLDERNYIGIDNSSVNIESYIIEHGLIGDFEEFLKNESDQVYDFSVTTADDKSLYCNIDGEKMMFVLIASTGTKSLELLFYWINRLEDSNASFVFIDEFDAFYHYELSMKIAQTMFAKPYQAFLSSHNTLLLTNDVIRPDCGFYINNCMIAPLCDLTDKELRQGHNIEKLYRGGAFAV